MTTEHEQPSAGPVRGVIAVLLGLFALAAALLRYEEYFHRFSVSGDALVSVPIAAALGLLFAWRRGGLSLLLVGLSLTSSAIVLAGMPELPAWASVDAFGFSPQFRWVVLAVLTFTIGYAGAGRERLQDGGLVAFVAFSAFSGPMFIRDPDVYFPLLILLGLVVALTFQNDERRSPWRIPFLLGFLVLLLISAVSMTGAEDPYLHVVGWTRLAIAGLPLVALGIGSARRARRAVGTYAAMVFCGVLCTVITIVEAGHFFSYSHALGTRLRLFGQDPNIIAPYFAVAPPLLLSLLVTARGVFVRLALLVTLAGSIGAVTLTGSRTSIVATVAGLGAFAALWVAVAVWRSRPSLRKGIAILAVALFAVGLAGTFMVKDKVLNHPSMKFRAYLWTTAVSAIEERPLLGYGFLSREPLMAHAVSSDLDGRPKDTHPHQIVLNMAMAAGVPAAALFVLLVAWFFLRMLMVSVRLPDREHWLLALAAFGSGVALLVANTLDQGLSLNTAFALHLGLLLGVGAMLVTRAKGGPVHEVSAASLMSGRVVLWIVAVAVALLNLQVLVDNRIYHRAVLRIQQGDLDRGDELTATALRVNPWSLKAHMQRADVLIKKQQRNDAIDLMWAASRQHPLSAQPWDQLSLLEAERQGYKSALNAAEEALRLDPTGKHVSEWTLRSATYLVRLRRHDQAVEKMAEAFRYDFFAPNKLTMKKIGDRWAYDVGGGARPIYLEAVLKANKALIPELCRTDPVKARRVATTIAKICQNFYLYDLAQDAIEAHNQHAPEKWLPLDILSQELKAAERARSLGTQGKVAPATTRREFQESDFEGTAGEAAIYVTRGNEFLLNGEPERAIKAYQLGIDVIYDMYSERGYAADLVDGMFRSYLKKGDFEQAEEWLGPACYFHRLAVDRVARYQMLADAYRVEGQHKLVIRSLRRAVPYMATLTPSRAGTVIADAAICLADYAKPVAPDNLQEMAWGVVDALGGSPQGRLFRAYLTREVGDKPEGRRLLKELAKDHPEWNLDRAKAPDWTPPPPEYTPPKDGRDG